MSQTLSIEFLVKWAKFHRNRTDRNFYLTPRPCSFDIAGKQPLYSAKKRRNDHIFPLATTSNIGVQRRDSMQAMLKCFSIKRSGKETAFLIGILGDPELTQDV
jgi:hypothetical protein